MEEIKKKLIKIDRDTYLSLLIIANSKGKKMKDLIQDILIHYVAEKNKPF